MRRSWKMKDAIKMMENNMSPEAVRRAHIKAEQDIMTIRLAQLREEKNVKQSEMANFTQSSVSKIEKRKDIKISTLIGQNSSFSKTHNFEENSVLISFAL